MKLTLKTPEQIESANKRDRIAKARLVYHNQQRGAYDYVIPSGKKVTQLYWGTYMQEVPIGAKSVYVRNAYSSGGQQKIKLVVCKLTVDCGDEKLTINILRRAEKVKQEEWDLGVEPI